MESLEAELARARELDVDEVAAAIRTIGFECTRCGACCKAETCGSGGEGGAAADEDGDVSDEDDGPAVESGASDVEAGGVADESAAEAAADEDVEPHTATVFPDEIRRLQAAGDYDFRDVARPMPYGLDEGEDGPEGETFEWALQTDDCGDCTFYEESDGEGACSVHEDRPLICRTYPFSLALGGTGQPMGEAVDEAGLVRAHECEGLGREIDAGAARDLAAALLERAIRDLEAAIEIRDGYEPVDAAGEVVVHDAEGAKRPDGSRYDG